jgi:phage terminase large subunit-like protein
MKIEKLHRDIRAKHELPHLHSFPFYKWSREFFESRNKRLFLTAGNQLSKSSTQIRKVIHWATDVKLWPQLWANRPLTFWYLYPSLKVFTAEVQKKWIPEFLPRGAMKESPQYGWRIEKDGQDVTAIHFNSGVSVYGKSYMTQEELLQTGSVSYLAFDEEMPVRLWPELVMRTAATDGYISGVFTPTLSQQFWFDVMEKRGMVGERFPHAHKITASLYDSREYEDGSPSPWSKERIIQIVNSLPSDDEIQRRVYGRFIINKSGLKFSAFSRLINVVPRKAIPEGWLWYAGLDSGSGGYDQGHPAAIVWLLVSPDYKHGRVYETWLGTPENVEGDDKQTTAGDVLVQYLKMKGDREVAQGSYDFADADMGVIAERNGIHLVKANKKNEYGEGMVNALFKNMILDIDDVPENEPLIEELTSLRKDQRKTKARDNAADALRYAVTGTPWDLSVISSKFLVKTEKKLVENNKSRPYVNYKPDYENQIDEEMEELNELYNGE